MKDRELAEYLDTNHSNLPFEYYEKKYLKQGYNGNLLYKKILEASNRTNKKVNKELGIA
ncbi:phage protein [Clostridium scatologenes]|uniref:Phage protein n=2 Tax=Clostridium scatologenes TaxID=1548 RepID=A0A0E3JNZ7_CLOSL|nr:phage protein [Clostridium scatologenes]